MKRETISELWARLLLVNPFATTQTGGDLTTKETKIKTVKPIEVVTAETSPEEYDQLVLTYLTERIGVSDMEDPSFALFRDASLYTSIFAAKPATFDQMAAGNVLTPFFPRLKNLSLLMDMLEDFGAIQYVGEFPAWKTELADLWLKKKVAEVFGESRSPVSNSLWSVLTMEVVVSSSQRFEILPETKSKLYSVLERYPEEPEL